jgi:hypothetical protein
MIKMADLNGFSIKHLRTSGAVGKGIVKKK